MKKYFEPVFVALFIIFMTAVNLWHVIYHAQSRPPNTVYVGISHHYEDYFYYLSQLTQGAQKSWEVKNLYTSEPIPATPLWWVNIILGKVSALLHVPVFTVYTASLFAATPLLLATLYLGSRMLFPKNTNLRLGTLLITVLATAGYRYIDGRIDPIVYFYNYTSSLNRLGGVTHLMLQNILSLLIILYGSAIIESDKKISRNTLIVSISAFLLAFINPVYVVLDAVAISLVALTRIRRKLLTSALIIGIPLLIPYILMQRTFDIPFYQYFRWWESSVLRAPTYNFWHSYGILIYLLPLGVIPFLKKGGALRWTGLVWAVLPVIMYWSPIPGILHIPVFRLTQPPQYLILGAIAAEGLWILCHPELVSGSRFINWMLKRVQHDGKKIYNHNNSKIILFWLLTTLFLINQYPMLYEEVRARRDNYTLISWLNHMDKNLYEGLMTFSTMPHNQIALAFNNLELIVPAISGHTVYQAHRSLTLEYPRKIGEAATFFTMQLTPSDALSFLKTNTIGYILWRKSDGDRREFEAYYPFLTKTYENSTLIIYTVQ